MISKKTSKNQITLPKRIVALFPGCEYFEITSADGRIVLRPVEVDGLAKVRRKLSELEIREEDVSAALDWARDKG